MVTGAGAADVDIRLINRIARRDQAAFAALYDRHCPLPFTPPLTILRDRGEAEDVLQEVFVRVWDRADRYDATLGSPAAWLVRISRNRAIDRLRSRTVRAGVQVPASDHAVPVADAARGADPEGLAV